MTSATEPHVINIGDAVPSCELVDLDGIKLDLKDLLSKGKTVIMFYRGHWCPLCNMQVHAFEVEKQAFADRGFQIITISTDTPEGGQETVTESGASFPVLLDINGQTTKTFGVWVEEPWDSDPLASRLGKFRFPVPSVFLTDEQGIIRWCYVGKDHRDRPTNADLFTAIDELFPS